MTTLQTRARQGDTDLSGSGVGTGVKAAGLAVVASDTGRVLMLQRALEEGDPAAGRWEFPGGGLEGGEDPLDAAKREWSEETGVELPPGAVIGKWRHGVYCGYVWQVGEEGDVPIFDSRGEVTNPDDPDGDRIEALAWWDLGQLTGSNPALRDELRQSVPKVLAAFGDVAPANLARSQPVLGAAQQRHLKDLHDQKSHGKWAAAKKALKAAQELSDLKQSISGAQAKAAARKSGSSGKAAGPTADRLRALSREEAAAEFDRLPIGTRNSLAKELKVSAAGLTNEGKKRRVLDALFSTKPAPRPVPAPETVAATASPTRMTQGEYTRLLKDELVRLHLLDGKTEKDARSLARPKASIDELKERNSTLRRKLLAAGVDYRTEEQKRTDDAEKNALLDEVERLAVAGGHDGPAKRAGASKMTVSELRRFVADTKAFEKRQTQRARFAREDEAARAAWEEARHSRRASPRQVDYIMKLLARRARTGEGGGFMVGPTDRAEVKKMSEADASAYIDSLLGNY